MKTKLRFTMILGALLLAAACGGSDSEDDDGGGSGGSPGGGGGGATGRCAQNPPIMCTDAGADCPFLTIDCGAACNNIRAWCNDGSCGADASQCVNLEYCETSCQSATGMLVTDVTFGCYAQAAQCSDVGACVTANCE